MVDGSEHRKATVPGETILNVTLTIASVTEPCATWKLVTVGAIANCSVRVATHAVASLFASTEPKTVT